MACPITPWTTPAPVPPGAGRRALSVWARLAIVGGLAFAAYLLLSLLAHDSAHADTRNSAAPLSAVSGNVVGPVVKTVTHVAEPVTDHVARPLMRTATHAAEPVTQTVTRVAKPVTTTVEHVARPITQTVTRVAKPVTTTVDHVAKPIAQTVTRVAKPVTTTVDHVARPITQTVTRVAKPITAHLITPSPGRAATHGAGSASGRAVPTPAAPRTTRPMAHPTAHHAATSAMPVPATLAGSTNAFTAVVTTGEQVGDALTTAGSSHSPMATTARPNLPTVPGAPGSPAAPDLVGGAGAPASASTSAGGLGGVVGILPQYPAQAARLTAWRAGSDPAWALLSRAEAIPTSPD